MIIEALNREKINYDLPTFTLDVNLIRLKPRNSLPPNLRPLVDLEYNYFYEESVELCKTPETDSEILKGTPLELQGSTAFKRFSKSNLYLNRPPGYVLDLNDMESNKLWMGIRYILWSSVSDEDLTPNQIADVSQMFYHTTASGCLENSAFLTQDAHFHKKAGEFRSELGVTVLFPDGAWNQFGSQYGLVKPTNEQIARFSLEHDDYLTRLEQGARIMN